MRIGHSKRHLLNRVFGGCKEEMFTQSGNFFSLSLLFFSLSLWTVRDAFCLFHGYSIHQASKQYSSMPVL